MGHFGTKNFKVKVDALPHTLRYGPEISHGHYYSLGNAQAKNLFSRLTHLEAMAL